jgi:hypothetical protein
MEYDQRAIIKFLSNQRTNTHEITQRFQTQFHEEAYNFELSNSELMIWAAIVKIFAIIFVLKDFLWMISNQKF